MKQLRLLLIFVLFSQFLCAQPTKQTIEKSNALAKKGELVKSLKTLAYAIQDKPKKKLITSFRSRYNQSINELDVKINHNLKELGVFLDVKEDVTLKEKMLSKVNETIALSEAGIEMIDVASSIEQIDYKKGIAPFQKPNYENVRLAGIKEKENLKLDLAEYHYQKGKLYMLEAEESRESYSLAKKEFAQSQEYILAYKNANDLEHRCEEASKQRIAVVDFQNSYSLEYAQYYVEDFKNEIKNRLQKLENVRLVKENKIEYDLNSEKRSNLDFESQIIQSAKKQDIDFVIVGEVSSSNLDKKILSNSYKNKKLKLLIKNTKSVDIDAEYRIINVKTQKTISEESFHDQCSVKGIRNALESAYGLEFSCKHSLPYSLSYSVFNRIRKF